MKRRATKDVFVIHTKTTVLDRTIVDCLAKLLLPHGFSVWGYSDWDWQVKERYEPTWEDALLTQGFLDADQEVEALNGDRPRFPPPVDRDALDKMLLETRAVIFLNPARSRLSDGMKEELASLRRLQRVRRFHENRAFPPPACFWCIHDGEDRDPYPLNTFGDGDLSWSAKLPLEVRDSKVEINSCLTVLVALAAVLLEQRASFVGQLSTAPRNTAELVRCISSPDDELSRCARVLTTAHLQADNSRPHEPLSNQVASLRILMQRHTATSIDWAPWERWRRSRA